MRRTLLLLWILLFYSLTSLPAHSQPENITSTYRNLIRDVYINTNPYVINFGNQKIYLTFGLGSAYNRFFVFSTEGVEVNSITNLADLIDFKIDGKRVLTSQEASFLRYEVSANPEASSATLKITYGVKPKSTRGYHYELTCLYTLYSEEERLERSAQLHFPAIAAPNENAPVQQFEGFLFGCLSSIPSTDQSYQIDLLGSYPDPFKQPLSTPLQALSSREIQLPTAPDRGAGVIAITRKEALSCRLYWMDTHGGETHYTPRFSYQKGILSLSFQDHRSYHLTPGCTIPSDTLRMEHFNGDLSDALMRYRQWITKNMPLATQTPSWVKQATLLQVHPADFKGGFREITQKLALYRQSGFNTLSLRAHRKEEYMPLDPYKVNPAYGTYQSLKRLVRQAHTLGMRVLFDLDIGWENNIPPLLKLPGQAIPEQDGNGEKNPDPNISTKWASPAYRHYVTSLALNDLRLYNIDGYRVLGASYKTGKGYPRKELPPYQSGTHSPQLLRGVLKTLQAQKRDFAMLSEASGAIFHTVCNLVQDGSLERVFHLVERLGRGKANAEEVKVNLFTGFEALPKGANRVFELRSGTTHSTAIEAIQVLCGIPMVFSGSSPLDAQEREGYRRLFDLRQRFPELAQGDLLLSEIESSHPMVFTALRRLKDRYVVIVVSLAKAPVKTTLYTSLPKLRFSALLVDPAQEKPVVGKFGAEGALNLTLQPNQVLIGILSDSVLEKEKVPR